MAVVWGELSKEDQSRLNKLSKDLGVRRSPLRDCLGAPLVRLLHLDGRSDPLARAQLIVRINRLLAEQVGDNDTGYIGQVGFNTVADAELSQRRLGARWEELRRRHGARWDPQTSARKFAAFRNDVLTALFEPPPLIAADELEQVQQREQSYQSVMVPPATAPAPSLDAYREALRAQHGVPRPSFYDHFRLAPVHVLTERGNLVVFDISVDAGPWVIGFTDPARFQEFRSHPENARYDRSTVSGGELITWIQELARPSGVFVDRPPLAPDYPVLTDSLWMTAAEVAGWSPAVGKGAS
jgi:hypothetical protein